MSASPSSLVLPTLSGLPADVLPTLEEVTEADAHLLVAELAADVLTIDGRCLQGLRYEALPILVLAIWAVMGGATSFPAIADAIADAAEDAAEELIDVIGLRHPRWGLPR